jgi:hypothetical protein
VSIDVDSLVIGSGGVIDAGTRGGGGGGTITVRLLRRLAPSPHSHWNCLALREEGRSYTTVGDTVNVAARLESFEKESFAREPEERVVRILVAESTRARLGPQYVSEEIGEMLLKGKSEAVRMHRVWPPQAVEGRP